ncbi:hypothetical protein GGX14DRAFT_579027 [Mycena pura]|uniref:Uncharacterized protein n=1 Tax=Mycena pura TaxID=153505 RepID=A0AAD6UVJ1_9AGAR|nr:hypothetical protein GGX14DRAFT_579027 [Mycena pura]
MLITVSSEPGQDLDTEALGLMTRDGDHAERESENGHEHEDIPSAGNFESEDPPLDWSPTPPRDAIGLDDAQGTFGSPPLPPPSFQLPKSGTLQNSTKTNTTHLQTPSTASSSSTPKARQPKRSRAEMLAEDAQHQVQVLAKLGEDKHARKLAEFEVKKRKYDVDYQREAAAALERRLASDEQRQQAEHQREREREQHQMQMLRLQLSAHTNGGGGARSDAMPLFPGNTCVPQQSLTDGGSARTDATQVPQQSLMGGGGRARSDSDVMPLYPQNTQVPQQSLTSGDPRSDVMPGLDTLFPGNAQERRFDFGMDNRLNAFDHPLRRITYLHRI